MGSRYGRKDSSKVLVASVSRQGWVSPLYRRTGSRRRHQETVAVEGIEAVREAIFEVEVMIEVVRTTGRLGASGSGGGS